MDHGFSRPKEPWELTDGCLYLLRELALNGKFDVFKKYAMKMADTARFDHFKHSSQMRETLMRSLQMIAAEADKKQFRGCVVLFLEATYDKCLRDPAMNTKVAAQDFVIAQCKKWGKSFYREIIRSEDDMYLDQLDRVIAQAEEEGLLPRDH